MGTSVSLLALLIFLENNQPNQGDCSRCQKISHKRPPSTVATVTHSLSKWRTVGLSHLQLSEHLSALLPLTAHGVVLLRGADQYLGFTDDPEASQHPAVSSESRLHLAYLHYSCFNCQKLSTFIYENFINQKFSPTKVHGA